MMNGKRKLYQHEYQDISDHHSQHEYQDISDHHSLRNELHDQPQ